MRPPTGDTDRSVHLQLQREESMRDEIRQLQSAQADLLHEHIRELQEENSWLVTHYGR